LHVAISASVPLQRASTPVIYTRAFGDESAALTAAVLAAFPALSAAVHALASALIESAAAATSGLAALTLSAYALAAAAVTAALLSAHVFFYASVPLQIRSTPETYIRAFGDESAALTAAVLAACPALSASVHALAFAFIESTAVATSGL